MASLIVAGDAVAADVATGKKFCAGVLYDATGTATGGGTPTGVDIGWNLATYPIKIEATAIDKPA